MNTDARLLAWREALRVALRAYLFALRRRWEVAPQHQGAADIERVVAAIGALPEPEACEREQLNDLLGQPPDGAFGRLAAALRLGPGEEALVACAWWAEADPQLAVVLGCAHDDSARRFPSAALLHIALAPFGVGVAPALSDESSLVRFGVLEPGAGAAQPLRLTGTARDLLAGAAPHPLEVAESLPPRLVTTVEALARYLARPAEPVVLCGPSGVGRRAVAAAAAESLGLVPVGGARPIAELRLLARARVALPIVSAQELAELGWSEQDGPLVAVAPAGEQVPVGFVVDVPGPSFAERELSWSAALSRAGLAPDRVDGLSAALSSRFAFTESDIAEVVARAERDARWGDGPLDAPGVWEAARRQPRHALRRLASLVHPAFTLDDLVLAPGARAQLDELIAHVELQHVVLDQWGFRRRLPRGQGVAALFAGPSGTGKTMAAEAVAHALGHDLYRVDLSAVISKYIGETEKNLAVAFDEAERASAVLFFDEADALFGRRTEVRDSHDRYANIEVNYLLQRVETFTGLVILATNRRSALDEAFVRRLRFVIRFELPDAAFRAELWRRSFPAGVVVDELDWEALAAAELSGGSIQGVAVAAAYLAAADGGAISPAHVEHAMRREYEKLGRAIPGHLSGGPA